MSGTATRRLSGKARSRLLGATGIVTLIAAWWLSAETIFSQIGVSPTGEGGTIPSPWDVIQALVTDGPMFYLSNLAVTAQEAALGYVWGNGIAIALAFLVVILPFVEGTVMQIAVISYCVPIVAIGPIVRIIIGVPSPGEPSGTAVFLAAMIPFFTTVTGALLGLRAADKTILELVTAYGGSRLTQLTKVRLIAALPATLNALKIAGPAAFLGAIIGEYMGGVDAGIGPALVNAQQNLNAPRAWALALVIGLASGLAYFLISVIARFVTPWTSGNAKGTVA
ncbi:ABC transporter permease [Microbacterium sediminicola]|uniref:ABC transporter permease n=1 Tax=Microbacterium sediminicola TaxID=415210 RepID=A0ABN2HZ01_9MICO